MQTESLILGYVYAQDQACTGRRLGAETFLYSAQDKCNGDGECACVHDLDCNGRYWIMYSGLTTTQDSACSWTKQGIIISKFE